MSNVYHQLSTGALQQNWSNTSLITTTDNWDGVPSIIGYLGDIDAGSPTNVDARNVTGDALGAVDVNANQTNPDTFNSGGTAEFQNGDPTVALNGSGSADAPSLVIHLNSTGQQNVRVQFNVRDLDGSVDNSAQQLAVQYRIGDTGSWTNAPGGYFGDVTNGPSLAGLTTAVDLILPSEANNQAMLQVRIVTTNAGGNDEWIGIDDINVGSQPLDNDTTTVSIGDATIVEGDNGTQILTFAVTRSDNEGAFTVDYATANDSANAGTDYVAANGTLTFTAGGDLTQQVSVIVNGDLDVEANETFAVNLTNLVNVTGDAAISDGAATGTIETDDFSITKISTVQGAGTASTMVGQTVTIEAIVVGDFQNGDADGARNLNGFYLQEETADFDANALTSEGIFVFQGGTDVNIGDRVRVTGTVSEFNGSTQITATNVEVVDAGAVADINTLAVDVDLLAADALQRPGTIANSSTNYYPDLESYEGMLVEFSQTLTVTEQFNLDRFVEVRLTAGDRPMAFTHENEPDVAGNAAHLADVAGRSIVYDDGLDAENTPIGNLDGYGPTYDTANAPRMGDTVQGLTGVLDWDFNQFRVRAVEDGSNEFVNTNPRPAAPADVGGTLQVGSFNVLNFFTTLDDGSMTSIGMEPRGANSTAEFDRQVEKLVTTIGTLDADVLGLVEIENDFLPGSSGNAIEFLVNELNAQYGAGTYSWINPGQQFVGGDAIAVAFIYKPDVVRVSLDSTIEILDDSDLPALGLADLVNESTVGGVFNGVNTSRAALAVTFEEIATGGEFTAVVNHLKSKSGTGTGADADQLDGQGNWQHQRELAAEALTAWLGTDPTGSDDGDFLLLGDFNSYFKEDTIDILKDAGFANLEEELLDDPYSYVFDGQAGSLDYILANGSLSDQVTGISPWHINSDEADALDYNLDFGRDPAIFDGQTPARVSDHDPLLIGLDLTEEHQTQTIGGVTVHNQADSTLTGSVDTPVGTDELSVTRLGSYITGSANPGDEVTAAEVFAFDKVTHQLFVKNNVTGFVEVVDISNPASMTKVDQIDIGAIPGFGGMQSIAIANGILAVAIQSDVPGENGMVAFYSTTTHQLIDTIEVGVLPDMITFTPDGLKLVVANEGERAFDQDDNELPDPAGSISLIDLSNGVAQATVQTTGFDMFDGHEDTLRALGVRITPGRSASTDIEPEYITLSADGKTAFVTLQEANSVGVFDISGTSPVLKTIQPLGYVDYSLDGNEGDFSDRDGAGNSGAINLHNAPIKGLLMPDAIASFEVGGVTYFITANEGDARSDDSDVGRLKDQDLNNDVFGASESDLRNDDNAGRLNVSLIDGDTHPTEAGLEEIFTFGGRGMTVFRVNQDGTIDKVDETGGEFSKILAAQAPTLFHSNQTNSTATFDTRSDDKGAEPEGVDVATIGDQTYAFVALERQGGLMVYNVTDPTNVKFTTYVSPFQQEDNGPEIVHFIPGEDSPTGEGLLITSNEISGSITAYAVEPTAPPNFTLQLLHLSDAEAGLLAGDTAPILAALVDRFDDEYANTLILSGGDNFIPGPFLNAGTDPSLNAVIGATAPGRPDIAMLNALGVEVSAIGNHEWDLGSNIYADAIRANGAWEGAQFAMVSANLDFTGDSAIRGLADVSLGGTAGDIAGAEASSIKGKIAPWVTVTEGGEKIGLLGATTQLLERISSPNGTEVNGFPKAGQPGDGTTEADNMDLLAAQLQPIIDEMLASGINKIILQSHLQDINNERLLATKLEGVDIILSAGSNTRLGDSDDEAAAFPGHSPDFADTYPIVTEGLDGKTTLIVNTDNEYTYLGRLVVEFDQNGDIVLDSLNESINGAYASTQETLEEVYGADIDEAFAEGSKGDEVRDITEAVDAVIAAKDGNIYGYTNVYLEGERSFVRTQETNFGNLSADANSFVAREALGGDEPIMVSLKNGGGIRAQIGAIEHDTGDKIPPIANPDADKPAGAVSQLDVENALRFDNKLMVFDTTAQGLLNILNWGAGLPANNGGFPQIGGVRFSYDPDLPGNNGAQVGSRIRDVALIDEDGNIIPIVDDGVVLANAPSVISVVTLNFTANGGDGYPVKANGDNFRYLLNDGSLSAPVSEALDFAAAANVPANALGEQQAFADYMEEFHSTPETAYNVADTPISGDTRIQNLNFREDTVLDGAPIMGDDGDNVIDGTNADDTILGLGGDDIINGRGGNDTINAGPGDDTVRGGGGDDTFVIDETVIPDNIQAAIQQLIDFVGPSHPMFETLLNQLLDQFVGDGADVYDGEGGFDTVDFSSWTKPVVIDLQEGSTPTQFGNDTFVRVENVNGGSGNDDISGTSGVNVLHGNGGDDILDGENGNDTLYGDAGNDKLFGGNGHDELHGGTGNDELDGGTGLNKLYGDAGNDKLTGGKDADKLYGGADNDILDGGSAGNDELHGEDGNDKLTSRDGNDKLYGGAGNDELSSGRGNDELFGGEGNDKLSGGISNDRLEGGTGDDILDGGDGNDILIGGEGDDILTGGGGKDQFVFLSADDGVDTITSFNTSNGSSRDEIVFNASIFQGFDADFDDLDAFGLIAGGYVRASQGQNGCDGNTKIQIDVDGGGDDFVTIAVVDGNLTNGTLADHLRLQPDFIA